jgi:predicted RNase H-like HicB family nuclease
MIQQFHALYEKDGDWWVASAVEIPGAFSQGKTVEEARENLLDAVRELMLARRELAEAEASGKPGIVQEELVVQLD